MRLNKAISQHSNFDSSMRLLGDPGAWPTSPDITPSLPSVKQGSSLDITQLWSTI